MTEACAVIGVKRLPVYHNDYKYLCSLAIRGISVAYL